MTLIELIMFIVIVSVGLAGLMSALNVTVRGSADPMVRKQMLSIAEALLEEVELQPFTYCDPTTDPTGEATATAASTAGGCTTVQGLGPGTTSQTRTGSPQFDNVPDYYVNGGLTINPVTDITGSSAGPSGYSAVITIVPEALGGIASANCASGTDCTAMNVLRIAVTVTSGSNSLTLEGYRARYWPNEAPW